MRNNRDEVCRENMARWDKERNELYPAMLPFLTSLNLDRINITGEDRNNHESPDVTAGKYYLIGYSGRWHISEAKRNYHNDGWEFNVGWYYVSLRSLEMIFEIYDMPTYQYEPAGRVEGLKDTSDELYDLTDDDGE